MFQQLFLLAPLIQGKIKPRKSKYIWFVFQGVHLLPMFFHYNPTKQGSTYNNLISSMSMVSYFWNEFYIPQRMWNAYCTFWIRPNRIQVLPIAPDPLSILILSKNCPNVEELVFFQSEIWRWWKTMSRTGSKNW